MHSIHLTHEENEAKKINNLHKVTELLLAKQDFGSRIPALFPGIKNLVDGKMVSLVIHTGILFLELVKYTRGNL
jgi:hypothetical protein